MMIQRAYEKLIWTLRGIATGRPLATSLLAVMLLALTQFSNAQIPAPAPEQSKRVLILNATIHTATGRVIEQGAIAFENGKITVVTNGLTAPDRSNYDQVIDASGKHVYPGFIAPNSTIGLTEIDAVRATRDFQETGAFNPHVRALIAYNTESRITPTVRSNGVLMVQTTPRGGLISGTSSVVQLDAWNWEDAVVRADDGIHLNWPRSYKRSGWWAEPGPTSKDDKAHERREQLRVFFSKAKAFANTAQPDDPDLRYEAMKGLFDGSKTLYIHAQRAKDIVSAIEFARSFEVKKIVLVGGYDAWKVPGVLKDNKVSVMLRRVHDLPMHEEDDVDLPYKLPKLLKEARIPFCLENSGDMEAMGARNLPFFAGTAAAYGLEPEEALASITLSTAKILGIDSTCGSLEEGKDATLFISTGDALDMRTNNVEAAWIQGREIDLSNPQKELYEKYKAKY